MDEGELLAQSFIVKIWPEEVDDASDYVVWRGCVIHVPSYRRHDFVDLNSLLHFIASHLESPTDHSSSR